MTAGYAATPPPVATARPLAVVIAPSATVERSVGQTLRDAGYEVRVSAALPDDLATAAVAVVEAGRDWCAIALMKHIHRLWPPLTIVGVLPWWDEDERELAGVVDFILHVPVRDHELRGLARCAAVAAVLHGRQRVEASAAV